MNQTQAENLSDNITDVDICPISLLWSQSVIDSTKPQLIVCIFGSFMHALFWLQIKVCPSLQQRSLQWIYAYLITDGFLLFRFFFTYVVRTRSTECTPDQSWIKFNYFFETMVDIYCNMLEVYIILLLNICRYAQIAYNRNLFVDYKNLLIVAHVNIYTIPLVLLIIESFAGWADLEVSVGDSPQMFYTNIYIQVINVIVAFALPIALNILVMYGSFRHIRLASHLGRVQNRETAREKYNRTLFIQFLGFYIFWLGLWSPNVIVDQISIDGEGVDNITTLLNYIEVALDPIIIMALDAHFYKIWSRVWTQMKNYVFSDRFQNQQVHPYPDHVNVIAMRH